MDKEWYDHIIEALIEVINAIIPCWESFLILFIAYTVLVVFLCRLYYKHKQDVLTALKERLDIKEKELSEKEAEYIRMANENQEMKHEIESPRYKAYLLARNLEDTDMDDSKMFSRQKSRAKK